MRHVITVIALLMSLHVQSAQGKDHYYQVVVSQPYIELHTGPGSGYPIFHIVERGESIDVMKRRTDWFKVRNERGIEGWASAAQLADTQGIDGAPARISNPGVEGYRERRREMGIQLGDFDGANILSIYGAYLFSANLSAELWGSHITGDFSNGWMVNANIVHQPFPEWRISPFVKLGTGFLHIDPKATLVASEDRTDQVGLVGLGLRTHLARRFVLRAEYTSYLVFTSRDDNEEVDEWKAGFSFFF